MENQNGIQEGLLEPPTKPVNTQISHDHTKTPITPYRTGKDALTRQEAAILLSLMDSVEAEALIRLAIATGLRRNDIVNITLASVNLDTKEITYWEHKKRREWMAHIDDITRASLIKHIAVNVKPIKSKWLFPSKRGGENHMCSRYAYNVFQKALQRAGLRKRPFHALRSTFVKLAKQAGWTDTQICQQTGDSLTVIQRHYATPSDGEMREIASTKPLV